MRWRDGRRSRNVEDRRHVRVTRRNATVGGGGIGLLGILLFFFLTGDLSFLGNYGTQNSTPVSQEENSTPLSQADQQAADFISVVLADTEDTWRKLFPQLFGQAYQDPALVLFRDAVVSGCGYGKQETGPFYCPKDQKIYLDLSFFETLSSRLGAPGDFAQAYVVAHEVGHHIQTLLGISQQVETAKRQNRRQANDLQVRMELQADCLAGVWAYHAQNTRNILERGDVEEAVRAATAIGDDTLQRNARGYVSPESFTHGSAQQRREWLLKGLQTGQFSACDTFK